MSGLFGIFDHRAHDLLLVANEHGFESSDDDPFGCARAPFPLLRRGTMRKVKTTLWRERDPHWMRVFDFRYFTDVGNDTIPSPVFTCTTALANAAWPYLAISPAPGKLGFGHRLDGHKDFDVLDPEFAEAFTVRTSDDQFATALLDVEMRRFLLDHARALDIEFNGAWLFAYAEHIPVNLVPDLFLFADDLLRKIPNVVGSLYTPPLKGDLDVPMPDPGTLAMMPRSGADNALDAFDVNESSGTERLVSSVLGFNNRLPFFGTTTFGEEAAQVAIDQDIVDTQSWTDVASPLHALDNSDEEVDLDGHPLPAEHEDPWGAGRPLPHGTGDA